MPGAVARARFQRISETRRAETRTTRLFVYPPVRAQDTDGTELPSSWGTTPVASLWANVTPADPSVDASDLLLSMRNPFHAEVSYEDVTQVDGDDNPVLVYGAKVVSSAGAEFVIAADPMVSTQVPRYGRLLMEGVRVV